MRDLKKKMVDFYACLFCKVVDFCMLIFKSGWFLRNKLSILQLTFQTFGLLCAISQSCGLLPMIFLNGGLFKVIDFYTCFFKCWTFTHDFQSYELLPMRFF